MRIGRSLGRILPRSPNAPNLWVFRWSNDSILHVADWRYSITDGARPFQLKDLIRDTLERE